MGGMYNGSRINKCEKREIIFGNNEWLELEGLIPTILNASNILFSVERIYF